MAAHMSKFQRTQAPDCLHLFAGIHLRPRVKVPWSVQNVQKVAQALKMTMHKTIFKYFSLWRHARTALPMNFYVKNPNRFLRFAKNFPFSLNLIVDRGTRSTATARHLSYPFVLKHPRVYYSFVIRNILSPKYRNKTRVYVNCRLLFGLLSRRQSLKKLLFTPEAIFISHNFSFIVWVSREQVEEDSRSDKVKT